MAAALFIWWTLLLALLVGGAIVAAVLVGTAIYIAALFTIFREVIHMSAWQWVRVFVWFVALGIVGAMLLGG